MDTRSIGQVVRRAGVGVETVRFYEREGLLEEPPRRASGYRQYSEQVVTRLHFIKRALQVPGFIQTHDGAEIGFEGREFAMPISEGSQQWRVAGVLRFKTDDSRYVWLNETFALTSGTFDYDSGMARWTAFVPRREAGSNDQGGW